MGLTLSQRQAVTKALAGHYAHADKAGKGRVLDELCATTGWHRNHARKALTAALRPAVVKPRSPRAPKYGPKVIAALIFCWTVLGMAASKRLAPILGELVGTLRRFGELDIDDDTAALLIGMSAATIDRRLAPERCKHELKGPGRPKPGSPRKGQIPIRTWAVWDDTAPGFVETDLVSHDGGNAASEHAWTLSVTDNATGWTENRSMPNNAGEWVLAALDEIAAVMPFPILGMDSANEAEFINAYLLAWCEKRRVTFTRSRPGNKNGGCPAEQKNCAIVHAALGRDRHDTKAQLLLLNKIWKLQSLLTNYFLPQQKLVSKVRIGAKVSKRYDTAITPYRRAASHDAITDEDKAILTDTYTSINPAAVQRQIQALTSELLTRTTSKAGPKTTASGMRASSIESTIKTSRAS